MLMVTVAGFYRSLMKVADRFWSFERLFEEIAIMGLEKLWLFGNKHDVF